MKATNLIKLKEANINVPNFIVIDKTDTNLEEKVMTFSQIPKVAIRSSHFSEDSQESSHAGQFDTYLNVTTDRLETVQKLLNSHDGMRVIMQEMIDSDYSGIIFTSNPQGLLNEMVINIGKGLGDKVVENKTNTTAYYRNKHNNKGYYETTKDSPVLDNCILDKLFKLGSDIENLYNTPMDIEFAIKDDIIYCLQARPITTFKKQSITILDNSNIVENFPGVVCPLTADFVSMVYGLAFRSAVSEIATKQQLLDYEYIFNNMVAENNSRMYYQLENWYQLLECLPFSNKLLVIWEEMIGISNVERTKSISGINKTKTGLKFIKIILKTQKEMTKLDNHFKNQIDIYRDRISSCTLKDSLQLYNEIKQDFGSKWGITLYNDLYAFISMALAKKIEGKVVQGIDGIESMRPVALLNEISLEQQNNNTSKVNELKSQYIQLYGDRYIEELKLETKTPRTNPELLDSIIPNKPITRILDTQLEDLSKAKFFEKRAKMSIEGREVSRLNRSRLFGVVREIFMHIGKEFVNLGYIDTVEDIFYLRYLEIENIINSDKVPKTDFRSVIEERKIILQVHSKLPTYDRLIFSDKPFNKYPLNISNSKTNIKNSNLIGTPASSGIYRGEAIIIDKVDLSIDVSNKIIVTESTDPGWVFLIENAGAIITERGSLLSHTSIITRELEKPAIVGIPDITKTIKSGDIIEINGTTGEVKILTRRG